MRLVASASRTLVLLAPSQRAVPALSRDHKPISAVTKTYWLRCNAFEAEFTWKTERSSPGS